MAVVAMWQQSRGAAGGSKGRRQSGRPEVHWQSPHWEQGWAWEDWSWSSWPAWEFSEPSRPSRGPKGGTKRPPAVAVYFGTFDPIHENHVGLAKFALEKNLARLVYLVVNGDNPLKPLAASYEERLTMVQRRLEALGDSRIRCFKLSREETQRMRWSDREKLCEKIRTKAATDLPEPHLQVLQLLGQDSFEKAVARSSESKGSKKGRGKGIVSTGIHFLVFPRGRDGGDVQIPHRMRGRVEIAKDYVDPVVLSSTEIRALASSTGGLDGRIHPALQKQVMEIYTRRRQFFLVFLGPPGSGKTTLGKRLSAEMGFYHLSGGEAYRTAKSRAAVSTKAEAHQQTYAKVFAALALAASKLKPAPVSFDGFLPKDLPEFEEKVGQLGLVVKLHCPEEELLKRLEARGLRAHDVGVQGSKRVAAYGQHSATYDAALHEHEDDANVIHELDADQPLDDVFQGLRTVVQKAAETHQLQLPEAGPAGQQQGSRQIIDEAFWSHIFQEIEASPAQSYNLRRNAASMQARQGSRSLKNLNNLVKDILIHWSLREVAASFPTGQERTISVLDVASGRGGDQLKFVKAAEAHDCRLCYTAIDVAEAQVQEATNRLRQRLDRDPALNRTLLAARFFVGDVAEVAPEEPSRSDGIQQQWFHVASIQFALHYAFSSCQTAQSFLKNSTGKLCSGGLLLVTTVDAGQMAHLAKHAQGLVYESELVRVTFSDPSQRAKIEAMAPEFGLRYRFDLAGEGIDCEEFVVPEELLRNLLRELDIEIIASFAFSALADLKDEMTSGKVANRILSRLDEHVEDSPSHFAVYDNLGLSLSRPEVETMSLYRLFVGRKHGAKAAGCPQMHEVAAANAKAASNATSLKVTDLRASIC